MWASVAVVHGLLGTWDLPRLGVEPVSTALAGGFFTIEPSRKPSYFYCVICTFLIDLQEFLVCSNTLSNICSLSTILSYNPLKSFEMLLQLIISHHAVFNSMLGKKFNFISVSLMLLKKKDILMSKTEFKSAVNFTVVLKCFLYSPLRKGMSSL